MAVSWQNFKNFNTIKSSPFSLVSDFITNKNKLRELSASKKKYARIIGQAESKIVLYTGFSLTLANMLRAEKRKQLAKMHQKKLSTIIK